MVAMIACMAGSTAAVALADKGRDHPEDTPSTGTTGTTGTTTTPSSGATPAIRKIEAGALSGGRLKLRTELSGRATKVRLSYRGRTYNAFKTGSQSWARTVAARGGDGAGSTVTVRVRACNASRCISRTGSDEA
jgi:hypothetical protein